MQQTFLGDVHLQPTIEVTAHYHHSPCFSFWLGIHSIRPHRRVHHLLESLVYLFVTRNVALPII